MAGQDKKAKTFSLFSKLLNAACVVVGGIEFVVSPKTEFRTDDINDDELLIGESSVSTMFVFELLSLFFLSSLVFIGVAVVVIVVVVTRELVVVANVTSSALHPESIVSALA